MNAAARNTVDGMLFVLGAILVLGVLLALALNSEGLRAYVEHMATQRAGRAVTLGRLHVRPVWPLRIAIDDLRIANPGWAQTTYLVDAAEAHATVELLPLFAGRLVVADLLLVQAKVGLEQEGGRATWRFGPTNDEQSVIALKRVAIDAGHITYRDPDEKTALEIDVASDPGRSGELALNGKGTFRGEPAQAVLVAPAILPGPDAPMKMTARGSVGPITITLSGVVRAAENGVDLRLELSGASLRDLGALLPVNPADTLPYRLAARLRNPHGAWTLEDIDGQVGGSDLRGSLTFDRNAGTPLLRAKLRSQRLDVAQLLGAGTGGLNPLAGDGTLGSVLRELAGPDVARAPRCAAADFDVKDGIAAARALVFDTPDTVIYASGTIDFKREFVDLVVHPAPKDPDSLVLRPPLAVSGPFKAPAVSPAPEPSAAHSTAAAPLAAVSRLLALAPFIEAGPGKDGDCARLADEVRLQAAAAERNEAPADATARRNPSSAAPAR